MMSTLCRRLNPVGCLTRLTLLALHLATVIQPLQGTLIFDSLHSTSSLLPLAGILDPSSSLVSSNGTFALGFFSSSTSPGMFGLGIWYNQLSAGGDQTVVWMPQRDLKLSKKAYLQLSPVGVLHLIDPLNSTSQLVWISGNTSPGTVLRLQDDGNLVLLDTTSSIIWQSFDTPTDTLLPGQALQLTTNQSLISWREADDWRDGYYFCTWLQINHTPSLSLYWNGQSILDWNLSSWSSNVTNTTNGATVYPYLIDFPGSDKLYFTPNGSVFAGKESSNNFSTVMSSSSNTEGILRRVTLEPDGVLRSYSWTNGNLENTWAVESIWPQQPCAVFAQCGPYGICSPAASQAYLGTCSCADGFQYIDQTNPSKGCKRKVEIPSDVCTTNTTKVAMMRVVGYTDFPYANRLQRFLDVTDEIWCRNQCLLDCRCAGAVFWRGGGRCYTKSEPLFNGGFAQDPSGDIGKHSSFLKVSLDRPSTDHRPGEVHRIIGAVAAGAALVSLVIAFGVWECWKRRRKQLRSMKSHVEFADHLMCPRKFTLRELSVATSNFSQSEMLGCGGMGSVYKGVLTKDKAIVAVKRIRHETRGSEQGFLAEASSISQIRHRNLVQLKGWCIEDGKFLLVYDYMPNGSLDQWLYEETRRQRTGKELSWDLRFSILADIAAALEYLHEDWQQCVLHRDVKSGNVLLDAEFNAHLGDFGLARLIDHQKMEKTTMMAGTFGYMAPEMPYTGRATKETDVYSFGVLMLEVVCGRKPMDSFSDLDNLEGEIVLLHRVQRAHKEGKLLSVVDPRLRITTQRSGNGGSINGDLKRQPEHDVNAEFSGALTRRVEEERVREDEQKMLVLKLGLLCCLPIPGARPSIRLVRQILTGDVTTVPALPDTAQWTHLDALDAARGGLHPHPLQESRSFSTSSSTSAGFHPEVRE